MSEKKLTFTNSQAALEYIIIEKMSIDSMKRQRKRKRVRTQNWVRECQSERVRE